MLVLVGFFCVLNLVWAENESAIKEINRKFEEVFERLKLLEVRNAQMERDNLEKEREIQELKERISILEGNSDDPRKPKDAGQEKGNQKMGERISRGLL